MKTYDSYEAAKIDNPDSEILKHDSGAFGLFYSAEEIKGGIGIYNQPCNPADHCMTVEKFLADGNKFQAGDLFIGTGGDVIDVEVGEHLEEMHRNQESDKYRYILRAAALEERKSQDGFESRCLVIKEKPHTKVEWVKVTDSIWHLESDFRAGELFAFDGGRDYVQIETEADFTISHSSDNLYRRIETPRTEREAFIDALNELFDQHVMSTSDLFNAILDSGKFKLVN